MRCRPGDSAGTVAAGSVFLANFPAMGPGMPEGDANVTIGRNLLVGTGATLVLGCTPSNGCVNTTSDVVGGNLVSMVCNSFEAGEGGLFPRIPAPNTVGHQRIGQCVLASPSTHGGPLGPGPF